MQLLPDLPPALLALADGASRPYIHLVDGGVSDNLGMRGVLDALELLEALHAAGKPTPLDHVRRIIVFVVNSLSSPPTNWDESENPPGTVDVLLKATGVPIDHYSYEAVEQLKDIASRWQTARELRTLAGCSTNKDSPVCTAIRVPQAEIYAIDVSFATLPDAAERLYLNQQPTSFVLPAEAVDRQPVWSVELTRPGSLLAEAEQEHEQDRRDAAEEVGVDDREGSDRKEHRPRQRAQHRQQEADQQHAACHAEDAGDERGHDGHGRQRPTSKAPARSAARTPSS